MSKTKEIRTRREFIAHIGKSAMVAAGASTILNALAADSAGENLNKTLVGSNIYGWGQYAEREKKTLDVEEVISKLRDGGYDYLESFMNVADPDANGKFADQLKAKGLRPVSLYVGGRMHEEGKAQETVQNILKAAKVCQQAGFQVLSCNADPIGREKTDAELKTQATALTQLGQGLNALGMKLGIHQHLPEMADHGREFHYVFDNTKAEVVGWCYDVHWVWKGGVPPTEGLKQYGDRVVTMHIRQSHDGVWCEELEPGDVDYAFVSKFVREHNLPRRFTVELALEGATKITNSAFENHRRSREFIRKTFGA